MTEQKLTNLVKFRRYLRIAKRVLGLVLKSWTALFEGVHYV